MSIDIIEDFEKDSFDPKGAILNNYNLYSKARDRDYRFAVRDYFYPDRKIKTTIYICKMTWTLEDARELSEEFESFYNGIRAIARVNEALPEDPKDNGTVLSDELCRLYDAYLSDFDISANEEESVKNAENRVGPGAFAGELIVYARRVYEWLKEGGPECVIKNESKALASYMCMHRFAEDITEITTYKPR